MLGTKLGNEQLAFVSDNPIARLNTFFRISIFLRFIPKSPQPPAPLR